MKNEYNAKNTDYYPNGNKLVNIFKTFNGIYEGLFQSWNRDSTRYMVVICKNGSEHSPKITFQHEK